MSVVPARRAALEVLRRVRERHAFAAPTVDAVLSATRLTDQDAALATRLAYGTLSAEGTLDEALDRFVARPGALEPRVRDVLRLAAYELLFARTPPRAAVHQAVEAVRAVRPQAAALANAVLRRLADAASEFPWGDVDADVTALARVTAHPRWLTERLVADLGRAAARPAMEADLEPAPLYLWANPFRASFDEALSALGADGADPVQCQLPGCLEARHPSAAVHGGAVAGGLALVTDAAAQLASLAAGAYPGGLVVDVASGRGTKTAQLQALAVAAGQPAHVYALDDHAFKSEILARRMVELGVPGVSAVTGDATDPGEVAGLPKSGSADAVLVDAPCSGTGTLRRHPEKRWRITPEQVTELATLQLAMLRSSARLVRPGGVVVYSTCSLLAEENADVVARFLEGAAGAGFRVAALGHAVPAQWSRFVTARGFFQSLPALGGPDGHFVAALTRQDV